MGELLLSQGTKLCVSVSLRSSQLLSSRSIFGFKSLQLWLLGHDGQAVGADQLARGRLVRPGQVEEVVHRVARFAVAHQVVVLGLTEHLAAVGDGLHVVLVFVARLVQGVLGESGSRVSFLLNENNKNFETDGCSKHYYKT